MGNVLGTDSEELTFTERGVDVVAVGLAHAVDLTFHANRAGAALAYALCGRAVRVWPEREFDPETAGVHPECAAAART